MFLLDTNIVSELRKLKPHGAVLQWFAEISSQNIFLPAVIFGEIQTGIEKTRKTDPAKANDLELWALDLERFNAVLPMTSSLFRSWAQLMVGRSPTLEADAMIAATAIHHHLIVVTRNTADFEIFPVRTFNPFLGIAYAGAAQ